MCLSPLKLEFRKPIKRLIVKQLVLVLMVMCSTNVELYNSICLIYLHN